MNEEPLTVDEEVHYANYGLVEICDVCGNYFSIRDYRDQTNFIEFNGKQFLCQKCSK